MPARLVAVDRTIVTPSREIKVGSSYAIDRQAVQSAPAWSPLNLPNLVLWLRADGIIGKNDGDLIDTWLDESGQGNHATAAGLGRPTYKVSIVNGLPILRFDGSANALTITDFDDSFSGITEGTLFVVFAVSNGDTNYGVLEFSGAGDGFWRFPDAPGTSYQATFRNARAGGIVIGQPTSGWHYHTIRSGPANAYDYRRNGSLDGQAAVNWAISADMLIGCENVQYLEGDIEEIIVCAEELSDDNVDATEEYIYNKVAQW